jgi:glycosyltransferase involved in cell wall biosynthesis
MLQILARALRAATGNRPRPMRILVACDRVVLAGGLLRFDRFAVRIAKGGHQLAFVALGSGAPDRATHVPVLSPAEADERQWDCVMVPGAGFPATTIAGFSRFRQPNYGRRIQHILSDQTRRAAFRSVNAAFEPHIVIFNNQHWPAGSYDEFNAERFHVLVGAVDTTRFRPKATQRPRNGRWTVGALANKIQPHLVEAIAGMDDVGLLLYGRDSHGLEARYPDLIQDGRLRLLGPLDEDQLPGFYHQIDCLVAADTFAGWINPAAEAMASGVPVICTRPGTLAFAHDEETALLINGTDPAEVLQKIRRLRGDNQLCQSLAGNARRLIEAYDWETYSRKLIELCR